MNTVRLPSKPRFHHALSGALAAACLPAVAAMATAGCGLLPECECDAALTKLVLDEPVAGGAGQFGLLVNYNGHSLCDDGDLCVEDPLPGGLTCDPDDPAYGSSSTVNPDWTCACQDGAVVRCCLNAELPESATTFPLIHVPVLVAADAPGKLKNCATIAQDFPGSFEDHTTDNNTSCVETELREPRVDLGIDKGHDKPLAFGEQATFHLVVSNYGDTPATGFPVTDELPAGFAFAGTPSPGWSCQAVSAAAPPHPETVTCTFSETLSPGTSTSLDLHVTLGDPAAFSGKEAMNCATVAASGDVNPANDSDCDPYCSGDSPLLFSTSGVDDDFDLGNGPESPEPSPELLGWIAQSYAFPGVRNYDDAAINRYFGHTFTDLGPPLGYSICDARVTLRVRCGDSNDAVALYFTDQAGVDTAQHWSHALQGAPFNAPCNGGAATDLILDLSNLPVSAGSTASSSLLSGLNAHGFLDVLVQDDTAVDYVSLDLTYCCP